MTWLSYNNRSRIRHSTERGKVACRQVLSSTLFHWFDGYFTQSNITCMHGKMSVQFSSTFKIIDTFWALIFQFWFDFVKIKRHFSVFWSKMVTIWFHFWYWCIYAIKFRSSKIFFKVWLYRIDREISKRSNYKCLGKMGIQMIRTLFYLYFKTHSIVKIAMCP